MEITTTCRRFKIEPDLKDHAEQRIGKLSRYFDSIQEAHLVLAQEKYRHIAELTIHGAGFDVTSRDQSNDMMSSIDKVVDRVERQIKKHAAKTKNRKSARLVPVGSVVEETELESVEVEEEFAPVVVRGTQVAPAPLTVEEGIKHMRENDWDMMLFQNSRSGNTAMLYHRDDGNYGLVEQS